MRRLTHSPVVLWLIAGAIVIALIAAYWNYVQDDVFITYAYSRNIAQGTGFVFNPGQQVQGTTTPLWALIMAGAYLVTPDPLHAGNLLGGVCLLIICALGWLLLRGFSHWTRAAAVLLLATSPLNYASLGMETLLYTALLFLAFWLWSRHSRALALLAAAALTWTRADGVVLAGALCLLALAEALPHARRQPSRLLAPVGYALVYALAIAPWFLFAWGYFGSPLPNTFAAKQEFLSGLDFLTEGVARWQTFFGSNPFSLLALPFIAFGGWAAAKQRALRPVPAWSFLYLLGYTALNITNFWYYTPLVNALILLAAVGAEIAVRWLARRLPPELVKAAAVIALLAAVGLNVVRAAQFSAPPPRMATYELAGKWIAQNTPEDATLLLADLGVAGYHARRNTLDSFGLITPDLPVKTPAFAVERFRPDYILATRYFLWDFTRDPEFQSRYRAVAAFSTPQDHEFSPMIVYQRRDLAPGQQTITLSDAVWDFAALEAVTLPSEPVWSGGSIALNLRWRGRTPARENLTVFVHLLGGTPAPVAQHDGDPANGTRPTSTWRAGEQIDDLREIALPPDLPAGEYTLLVGWYARETGARIPLTDGADSYTLPVTVAVRWPGGSGAP